MVVQPDLILAIAFLRWMEICDRYEHIFGIISIPVTDDVEAGQPSLPIEKTEFGLSQSGDREKKR